MSLSEIIINCLLSACFCVLISFAFKTAIKAEKNLAVKANQELIYNIIDSHILAALNNLDQHNLKIFPRIHAPGKITLSNGTNISTSLNIKSESESLTYSQINILEAQRVINLNQNQFTVCPIFQKNFKTESHKSYLGIYSHGILELRNIMPIQSLNNNCRILHLSFETSMLAGNNFEDKNYIKIIIPINSINAVFIDQNDTLRLLSHTGSKITENQPLASGIKYLDFEIENSELFSIKAKLFFNHDFSRKIYLKNKLARSSIEQLLIQMPL